MPDDLDIITCEDAAAWDTWLADNHRLQRGVWIRIAKQHTAVRSMTNDEAVDVGLCWGWISGHRKALDDTYFLQRYTPRRARSNLVRSEHRQGRCPHCRWTHAATRPSGGRCRQG